jgi:DNA-binding transcriptional regulator YiaG
MPFKERDYPSFLKFIRAELGLSQEDLAREIRVSWASVNRWENGKAAPSKMAKERLERYCVRKVRQGKLVLAEDEM